MMYHARHAVMLYQQFAEIGGQMIEVGFGVVYKGDDLALQAVDGFP